MSRMLSDGKYTYAGVGVGLSFGILFYVIFDWNVALTGAFMGSLAYLLGLHFGQDRDEEAADAQPAAQTSGEQPQDAE